MSITIRNIISKGRLIGKYLAKDQPESLRAQIDAWISTIPGQRGNF